MRLLARIFIIPILFLAALSCSSDNNNGSPAVTYTTFNATLTGAGERPNPTSSFASGTAILTYNNSAKTFTITVTYSGLTPIAGHVHKGTVDEAGPVVFGFTGSLASPINYTSPVLTSEQEADLMSNDYYVNLHTENFPDGEIRGQLIKQASPPSGGGGGY